MSQFVQGRGIILEIAPLPAGVIVEPTRVTAITTTGTAAIAATSITLTGALGAGVLIPSGSYLLFTLSTGATVPVKLTADAKTGDTTLAVVALVAAITTGAVGVYPLRLTNRTSADIERTGKTTSLITFDDGSWASSKTTSLEGKFSCAGAWSQIDASYNTCEAWWTAGKDVYVWITFPAPSAAYTTGTVFKGVCNIVSLPVKAPADGIVTGDISFQVNGVLYKVDPVAA